MKTDKLPYLENLYNSSALKLFSILCPVPPNLVPLPIRLIILFSLFAYAQNQPPKPIKTKNQRQHTLLPHTLLILKRV